MQRLVEARAARNSSAPTLPLLVISGDSDALCAPAALEAAVVAPLRRAGARAVTARWSRKRHGDHCLSRYRGEAVQEAVRWAVRCCGLEGVECGERLGSPWIRCQAAFDFFPVALVAVHAAGWFAGAFAVSPGGRALAAAEAEEELARGLEESRQRREEAARR